MKGPTKPKTGTSQPFGGKPVAKDAKVTDK